MKDKKSGGVKNGIQATGSGILKNDFFKRNGSRTALTYP
jgi:hypothetical protein